MTSAPANLLTARRLLLDELDMHPGAGIYPADLDPAEVGIVGDEDHRGGYHCGEDRLNPSSDYSVVESPRDRTGLTGYASALDVGQFEVRVAGKVHNLRTFSVWLVAQCKANTPDTRDIREVIYSPDGRTVKRWDRLGRRTSGDTSHRTHTHISVFRDATKAGRDLTAVFRRYLTEIGVIEGDDMATPQEVWAHRITSPGLGVDAVAGDWLKKIETVRRELEDARKDLLAARALLDQAAADVAEIKARPAGTVVLDDEQLERALRAVLGSVDGATPPAEA
jgi:hypothetical protein